MNRKLVVEELTPTLISPFATGEDCFFPLRRGKLVLSQLESTNCLSEQSEESQRNNEIPPLRLGMTSFSNQVDWALDSLLDSFSNLLAAQ